MDRVRATYELDKRVEVAIRRRARNLGLSDSEFVNRTFTDLLHLDVLDRIRQVRSDLTEEEALDLAYEELDAARADRERGQDAVDNGRS
ncbi:MAG: hypothetical protein J2P40_03620 [Candidatus Dormibacteraeota bacterium]|nr:hypothetical protein [Candidatus Dormibacteraeota bacterium]MBO0760343.1 hypothetical protein [Candidatus Dormibacteraeota bacterium]